MKKLVFLLMTLVAFAVVTTGCDGAEKAAAEAAKKQVMKLDSISTEIEKSAEELKSKATETEKEVDDLLKDI